MGRLSRGSRGALSQRFTMEDRHDERFGCPLEVPDPFGRKVLARKMGLDRCARGSVSSCRVHCAGKRLGSDGDERACRWPRNDCCRGYRDR